MMRQPTEMELRVAKYLLGFLHKDAVEGVDDIAAARAAIRAMYEPTEEMATCGGYAFGVDQPIKVEVDPAYHHDDDPDFLAVGGRQCWQAMIDAASPPEPDDAK